MAFQYSSIGIGIGIDRNGRLERKDVINCLPLKQVEKLLAV